MLEVSEEHKKLLRRIIASVSPVCPKCGGPACMRNKKGEPVVLCSWRGCKKQTTIWYNTPFYNVKVPIDRLILLLDLWLKKYNMNQMAELMGLSRQTISHLFKCFKEVIVPRYYNHLQPVGGEGIIVEIDESKFGKRKYHRGHRVDGVWVLGLVEWTLERKIVLLPLENRKEETLTPLIEKYVHPHSYIYTDGWAAYRNLSASFSQHLSVNHSLHFVDPVTKAHTNTIEGNWYGVKLQTSIRNRTRGSVSLFLARFMLLRNNPDHALEELLICLLKG